MFSLVCDPPIVQVASRAMHSPAQRMMTHVCGVQLCKAYRSDGGRTIVIMSQQPKLEMEATFRRTIPKNQRFGSGFVFRQVDFCSCHGVLAKNVISRMLLIAACFIEHPQLACVQHHVNASMRQCSDAPARDIAVYAYGVCADRLFAVWQGSPLLPDDLRGVNVENAHAMVIISDNSRCAGFWVVRTVTVSTADNNALSIGECARVDATDCSHAVSPALYALQAKNPLPYLCRQRPQRDVFAWPAQGVGCSVHPVTFATAGTRKRLTRSRYEQRS